MKVSLVDYTGKHHNDPAAYAASVLIFTKQTRLNMHASGINSILDNYSHLKKLQELEYAANTIPSSWEMIHYTFVVEGVTRGFTHQFVRSRNWSFAQQTMRILDVSQGDGWDYGTGPTIANEPGLCGNYVSTMAYIGRAYKWLIEGGAAVEDARGVLPTNILTNIVASGNMRSFVELVRKRSSSRTQGEYRDVLEAMKAAVREVHPWIDIFIDRTFDKAANELDAELRALEIPQEKKTNLIKLIDQLRSQS